MARVLVEGHTSDELIAMYKDGKKISMMLVDDGELFFRTTIAKLKKKVNKEKGFRVSKNAKDDITFEEYSDIVIDSSNRRHVKFGTKDNKDRSGKDRVKTSKEFDAYVSEFGIDNLRLKSEISIEEIEIDGKEKKEK